MQIEIYYESSSILGVLEESVNARREGKLI